MEGEMEDLGVLVAARGMHGMAWLVVQASKADVLRRVFFLAVSRSLGFWDYRDGVLSFLAFIWSFRLESYLFCLGFFVLDGSGGGDISSCVPVHRIQKPPERLVGEKGATRLTLALLDPSYNHRQIP